jgi:hypothetical protein
VAGQLKELQDQVVNDAVDNLRVTIAQTFAAALTPSTRKAPTSPESEQSKKHR